MKAPKLIITIPPIWLNPEVKLVAELANTLFRMTPKIEKTIENPRTKNTVFIRMLILFETRFTVPFCLCNSEMVVPDMYARNAGMTGKMQGAKNEPNPAMAAIAIDISGIVLNSFFFY